jgi:uncharacterized protein (DUF2237 family)
MKILRTLFYVLFLLKVSWAAAQDKNISKENCLITTSTNLKAKAVKSSQKNVLGSDLQLASINPMTGFFRNGYCETNPSDGGVHVVAAVVTDEFLKYSLSKGNDLISAYPSSGFPGLKAGDVWCLCANLWKEALKAGVAPPVILESTNIKALNFVTLDQLKNNAVK